MSGRRESGLAAYKFFRDHAIANMAFDALKIEGATGWAEVTFKTYCSKKMNGYVERVPSNFQVGTNPQWKVKREFIAVTESEFLDIFTQKTLTFPAYQRHKHEQLITYEFLLPLTKEGELRKALDNLFYVDTLGLRLKEIGLDNMSRVIRRLSTESDDDYIWRVCNVVSGYFGGYSISHVQGRFLAHHVLSRREAAKLLTKNARYLIDETTAVVRFVIPCGEAKQSFDEDFDAIVVALNDYPDIDTAELQEEIKLIRCLFFFFFVEAVVRTIKNEDEIWLLETGPRRRLYRWQRGLM